jgi:hypothetical protein
LDTTAVNQSDTELAEILHQLVSQIQQNQKMISDILSELVREQPSTDTTNPDIHSLLSQMIEETKQNHLTNADVPAQLAPIIEAKLKSGMSASEMTAFLQQILGNANKKSLTAPEVSALWLQYMGDSMAICMYKYFLAIVENEQIKTILTHSLQLAESHLTKIAEFLKRADFQVPVGFTENDVNVRAPRLFSDQFLLFYSNIMTIHGLTAYSLAITNSERQDIQNYFFECAKESKELYQEIVSLAKHQPNFTRAPSVPSPHRVEFMNSPGIIENLLGDKRPLNSSEITNLFFNSKKTGFVRTLSLAFSQVAGLEDVRHFMLKNVKLAGKDAESFDAILLQDNLPIPEKWDADISDSTVSPFSDKLMMFHAALLVNAALSYYGAALGSSLRTDIILNYKNVFKHAMQAGALCYNILVKHEWLEKQPEAIDRRSLTEDTK